MEKLSEQKKIVKLEKKLDKDFVAKVQAMSKSELEFEFRKLNVHREDIKATKAMDEELNKAREEVKELNAPYAEQLKSSNLMIEFIYLHIKETEGK
jgi:hypothetical protein